MSYPKDLLTLIAFFKKFPGIGTKTAERFSFNLLKWSEQELKQLGALLIDLQTKISHCSECGCLTTVAESCSFCQNIHRDHQLLCIISSSKDAFSIEATKIYNGLYHVIDALLSPLEGRNEESLHLNRLDRRIQKLGSKEIIIALDSTLEGDATALFLKNHFEKYPNLKSTRLAFGLPVGCSLDYIDDGTLSRAFLGRVHF